MKNRFNTGSLLLLTNMVFFFCSCGASKPTVVADSDSIKVAHRRVIYDTTLSNEDYEFMHKLLEPYAGAGQYIRPGGYVLDKKTAIMIAEAVWLPIYGDEIYDKMPLQVYSFDSVWIVTGSLPEGYHGGVPHVRIRKSDGAIMNVWHDK